MSALRGLPYLAAVVLAGVFLVAAAAKWRDPAGTARGFRALGVPRPWTAARTVPAVEAALAVGLLLVPAGMALLAAALLVAFTVFLSLRLRAGVSAACHCFGGRGTDPLSVADVVRNVWLIATATVACVGDWPRWPSTAAVVVAVVVALTAVTSTRALRRRGRAGPISPRRSNPTATESDRH